jgi:peptidoglycan/xylan/chitin deacetylase (PgdA/CDA1 family)
MRAPDPTPIRLDRLLTVFAGRQFAAVPSRAHHIPILMYHSISNDLDSDRLPYYRTVTRPQTFERHMRLLQREGYEVVSLSKAARCLRGSNDLVQPRRVVLTFDDGFRDFRTAAYPMLSEFGFTATVFLASGFLNGIFPTGRECLHSHEVKELASRGVEFGSHTVTHPQLRSIPSCSIYRELRESRLAIEDTTGSAVTQFSYPYGFPEEDPVFVEMLASSLESCGYTQGVTTSIGRCSSADNPLFLRRLPVNDLDDDAFLLAKLAGGYDWLHKGQLLFKKMKASFRRTAHW